MIAMLAAVFAASVIGSLHCVVMCGPLVAIHHRSAGSVSSLVALHHAGRLVAYLLLGIVAGAVGGAVEIAGELLHVQRGALIITGVGLLLWGAVIIHKTLGASAASTASGRPDSAFGSAVRKIGVRAPRKRAALLGMMSGLLPCGWLWAFVITAAGTASWWKAAVVMAVFWAGTLPVLVGASTLLGPILGRFRRRWPLVTGAVLIALGMVVLVARVPLVRSHEAAQPSCHRQGHVP